MKMSAKQYHTKFEHIYDKILSDFESITKSKYIFKSDSFQCFPHHSVCHSIFPYDPSMR